jgi:hypothetical protein
MICQVCGVEAPTKRVEFHQNIGALVMRFSRTIKGNLCKSCIHKNFWKYTLINITLGWWGVVSLICTPIFIINNLVRYIGCLGMPPVPRGAIAPTITPEVFAAIQPKQDLIIKRINAGDPLDKVAAEFAPHIGVTPGQICLYVRHLIDASKKR